MTWYRVFAVKTRAHKPHALAGVVSDHLVEAESEKHAKDIVKAAKPGWQAKHAEPVEEK